jgi:hypothetical protein
MPEIKKSLAQIGRVAVLAISSLHFRAVLIEASQIEPDSRTLLTKWPPPHCYRYVLDLQAGNF